MEELRDRTMQSVERHVADLEEAVRHLCKVAGIDEWQAPAIQLLEKLGRLFPKRIKAQEELTAPYLKRSCALQSENRILRAQNDDLSKRLAMYRDESRRTQITLLGLSKEPQ